VSVMTLQKARDLAMTTKTVLEDHRISHDSDGNPRRVIYPDCVIELAALAATQQMSLEAVVSAVEEVFTAHEQLVLPDNRMTT
jgi:hypothetical protein